MYLTMNRFKIRPGHEAEFEAVWLGRDSQLPAVPGFVAFNLLKGELTEDHRLYVSHTVWENEAAFQAWTRSEAFRSAHANARPASGGGRPAYYAGPNAVELFTSVQSITA